MNRLTGGQAKNERDIMIQLKSTVHGGGALDDMPNAVVMAMMVAMMVMMLMLVMITLRRMMIGGDVCVCQWC